MYYKLLNKTILSSTFVALICLWTSQAAAQDEAQKAQTADAPVPATEDVIFEVEDDIIPLNQDELIVPEQKSETVVIEQKPVQENKDAPKTDAKSQVPAVAPAPTAAPAPVAAPAPKKVESPVAAPAPKKVDEPAKSDDVFVDDFELNFDDEPFADTKDLFEEKPISAEVKKADKSGANVSGSKAAQNKNLKKDVAQKNPSQNTLKFGDSILAQTNNDLFNQMSDIEKQTTLLTLELKREKIRNEVEAAKAVREKAEREKIAQEEEKARQKAEWKKEQEIKLLKAQEELKAKEIELEKIAQRKALTAYMNSMLEQKQSWISENSKLYDEIRKLKDTNSTLRASYQSDLNQVNDQSSKLVKSAEIARNNYERAVASLSAQNAQLRKRLETMEQSLKNSASNPFAGDKSSTVSGNQIATSADTLIKPVNIAKEYAIMEIIGQGDELLVKLINKEGDSFVAKVGTVLQSGHMIEEITPQYVQFDRNGLKDFLYTATSALSMEPKKMSDEDNDAQDTANMPARPRAPLISDDTLPSVGDSMFVK